MLTNWLANWLVNWFTFQNKKLSTLQNLKGAKHLQKLNHKSDFISIYE
jgi:hypothetical protein